MRTFLIAVIAFAALAAPAQASAPRVCVPVKAEGVGQDLGGGRTTATISSHGIRLGTTSAQFVFTDTGFGGTIDFTSRIGTLSAQVTGTFGPAPGAFNANAEIVSGTKAFRGATGHVVLNGVEDASDGSFTETITGRLCV